MNILTKKVDEVQARQGRVEVIENFDSFTTNDFLDMTIDANDFGSTMQHDQSMALSP